VDDAEEPIAKADPSRTAEDHAEVDDRLQSVDDNSVRFSLAWWLSFAVPISIAMVAILGAVVGYRAESHASLASDLDNDAQVASTYKSGHTYNALLLAELAASDHDLWQELAGADGKSAGPPMVAAAEPACANASGSPSSLPAAEFAVNCQLAQLFSAFAYPGYWKNGNPADFATTRYEADWAALSNLERDVAVFQHETSANTERDLETRLLWLGLLLALALAFCTLAQAALHHQWSKRTTLTSLLLAIPGWILLIGCGALLLAWEL
jgi:hypothetical protein